MDILQRPYRVAPGVLFRDIFIALKRNRRRGRRDDGRNYAAPSRRLNRSLRKSKQLIIRNTMPEAEARPMNGEALVKSANSSVEWRFADESL
ncbi:hypothetical protein [Burkholderia stagnalis]|uniref:hypothetical protein n=1 Tax=Burkholderia stagnalis TaxID=1503054 RepID=UPI0012D9C568|nr:hypothetical protein [Burkholderia stagnalis]